MCRLFAVSADESISLYSVGEDLTRFRDLATYHGDGWGIGTLNEIRKEPISALADESFNAATDEMVATDFVLHLRRASCTTHNRRCDTHPWAAETRFGPMVFAHNGHIFGLPKLDKLVAEHLSDPPFCHTDSGRFLNLVAALLATRSIEQALIDAVSMVENVTTHVALNCVLVAEDGLWVMQAANPTMDYWPTPDPPLTANFTLREHLTAGRAVISSNGWTPVSTGWTDFNNREIRHYRDGRLAEVYSLPKWAPGFDPIPQEKLLVNPD